jgi:hypothetical protein
VGGNLVRSNGSAVPSRLWLAMALLTALILTTPHAAFAQSCALCYTQAAASTQRFIQALRSGILILMIPPMCLSIVVMLVAYKRRNQFHQQS